MIIHFLFGFVFRSFEMKKILGYQYFLLLLIIWISASNSNQICVSNQTVSFVNQFLNIHGNGSQISKQTLEKIFTDFTGQKNFYDECQKSVDKSCAINKVRCPNVHSLNHIPNMYYSNFEENIAHVHVLGNRMIP